MGYGVCISDKISNVEINGFYIAETGITKNGILKLYSHSLKNKVPFMYCLRLLRKEWEYKICFYFLKVEKC